MIAVDIDMIFPLGEKFESPYFSSDVWLNMPSPYDSPCPVFNVTFEPGCHNNWHYHQRGQILLITAGRGYYQEWEMPAKELHRGDVVNIPAQVKHWHGAAKDSWFSHLAIEVQPEKGPVQWLEPVNAEDYNKLQ